MPNVIVSWTPPTTYADGVTPMPVSEIEIYRVKISIDGAPQTESIVSPPAVSLSTTIPAGSSATYTIQTQAKDGQLSVVSAPASVSSPQAPGAPTGLSAVIV